MRRGIISIIFTVILLLSFTLTSFAHESEDEHDKELESVLFEPDYMREATYQSRQRVRAIEKALALTTDQQGENGQSKLDDLNSLGVKGIAQNVSDISVAYHRYSHKGWGYSYDETEVPWKKRKNVLVATINHEIRFSEPSNSLTNYCDECNSLAALFYYVHIIGDHEVQKTWKNAMDIIPLGGEYERDDEDNVINALIMHSEILFQSQKKTKEYRTYIKKLKKLNKKVKILYSADNKMSDADKVKQLNSYSDALLTIMREYVPDLLKNEEYFRNSFYLN